MTQLIDARTLFELFRKGRNQDDILIPVHNVDYEIECCHDEEQNPYLWSDNPVIELSSWRCDLHPETIFTFDGMGFKFSFTKDEAITIIEFLTQKLKEMNNE